MKSSRALALIGFLAVLSAAAFIFVHQKNSFRASEHVSIVTVEEIAENPGKYFIVDIREPEEYDQGHFDGAVHVPLGTFLSDEAVRAQVLVNAGGRQIVFFCHDGIRSSIAADALDMEGVSLITNGFKQMQKEGVGDMWIGSRTYSLPYAFRGDLNQRKYILKDLPEGATLVDLTWNQYYSSDERVVSAPMMRLSEEENEKIVASVAGKEFVGLCNSRLSCFYAKILGYRAEQKDGTFLGFLVSREFEERIDHGS